METPYKAPVELTEATVARDVVQVPVPEPKVSIRLITLPTQTLGPPVIIPALGRGVTVIVAVLTLHIKP